MRVQRESHLVWAIAISALLVIFSLRCFDSNVVLEADATFLYNRCWQMLDCLRHGYYPFIYYNDIGGIGYGSPIFYGQATLFPFMLFLADILVFIKAYFLVCLLVNFFGFRCFVKRFSSYGTLSACFYILGVPYIFMCSSGMYAATLATGFSWFFFAFCIDFFRDGKGMAFLILTYFLIWQSNFNSVVLATVVCVGIFLLFFRLSRWRSYLKLFLCVLALILYNIVNILVHLDSLRLADFSTLFPGDMELLRVVLSCTPFGGFLYRSVGISLYGYDLCCGFMSFGMLVVLVHYLRDGFLKQSLEYRLCAVGVLALASLGYFVGMYPIWGTVFQVTNAFFQWPLRYFIIMWGFVVAVLARVVKPDKWVCFVLILCVLDIFVANPLSASSTAGGVDFLLLNMGHGEYAGETFEKSMDVYEEWSTAVHSESGAVYTYVNDYNGLSVDCSANPGEDVLTLPKLYYNGYEARGSDGEVFPLSSGYSNYCEVGIGSYQGVLTLRYRVHGVVLVCFWIQVIGLFILSGYIVMSFVKRRFR